MFKERIKVRKIVIWKNNDYVMDWIEDSRAPGGMRKGLVKNDEDHKVSMNNDIVRDAIEETILLHRSEKKWPLMVEFIGVEIEDPEMEYPMYFNVILDVTFKEKDD